MSIDWVGTDKTTYLEALTREIEDPHAGLLDRLQACRTKRKFINRWLEMTKVIIRTGAVKGFFERARKVAQKADSGEPIFKSETITFEGPQEKAIALSNRAVKDRGA